MLVDPVSRQSLYIYFTDWQTSGGGAGIRFIRSTDGGLTWGQAITVVVPGQAASTEFGLVVNPQTGNFHLAYAQAGSLYEIAAMTSTDRGTTWSSPVRFVTNVSTSVSMALTSDGTIAVMYQSFGLRAGYSMMTSVDGGLTWNRPVQVAAVDASRRTTSWVITCLTLLIAAAGPPDYVGVDVCAAPPKPSRCGLPRVRNS